MYVRKTDKENERKSQIKKFATCTIRKEKSKCIQYITKIRSANFKLLSQNHKTF